LHRHSWLCGFMSLTGYSIRRQLQKPHSQEWLCYENPVYFPVAEAEDSAAPARVSPRRRTSIPSRLIF